MAKLLAISLLASVLLCGMLWASYTIGYQNGAAVGYQAGVEQHRLYTKGHDMAADWNTYITFHRW